MRNRVTRVEWSVATWELIAGMGMREIGQVLGDFLRNKVYKGIGTEESKDLRT